MMFKEQTKNDLPVHNNGLVGGFNSIENYSYHKYEIIP